MTRHSTYISGLLILACLLPSCRKSDIGEPRQGASAISLSSPQFIPQTRGTDPLQDDNLKNFGISAIYNFDGTGENRWYLSEQAVIKGAGEHEWVINPQAYWPLFGDLSFFFHAPSNINYPEIKFIETGTGLPMVEFTPSTTDIAGQIDFCMGRPVMHYTQADNPVPVHLEHTLTQLMFYANYTGRIPKGFFMLITEVKVKNVVGTKRATYSTSEPYYVWEDESAHTADSVYVLERSKNHMAQDSIRISKGLDPDTYYPLSNSPGRLYLLPQTLGPDAVIEVTYGFYTNYGANPTLIAMFAKEVPLPEGQVWHGGETINYQMTVDVGISSPIKLTCTITDWVSSGNTHAQQEYE